MSASYVGAELGDREIQNINRARDFFSFPLEDCQHAIRDIRGIGAACKLSSRTNATCSLAEEERRKMLKARWQKNKHSVEANRNTEISFAPVQHKDLFLPQSWGGCIFWKQNRGNQAQQAHVLYCAHRSTRPPDGL